MYYTTRRLDFKLSLLYGSADLIILNTSITTTLKLFLNHSEISLHFTKFLLFSAIWLILAFASNLYRFTRNSNYNFRLINYLKCHIAFASLSLLICFSYGVEEQLKPVIFVFALLFPLSNMVGVSAIMYSIGHMRMLGWNTKKVLIIGTGKTSTQIQNYIKSNPDFGYKIVGIIPDHSNDSDNWELLQNSLSDFKLDEVIITSPTTQQKKIQYIIKHADFLGLRVRLIPDFGSLFGNDFTMSTFGELPVINVKAISLDKSYLAAIKRLFDIAFSLLAIAFFIPGMLCIIVAILIDSKGPVLYCPIRVGKGGREFKLFKFRSMHIDRSMPPAISSTQKNDPRLTQVGRFIRKYSLDELPQFFNVLMGDMSVVGPRPHRVMLNQKMQHEVDRYMLRHYLKPGITGWAQVNGWRGPTETQEERHQRTQHDLWYIQNWSFALDLKIVLKTIFDPKTHRGAF